MAGAEGAGIKKVVVVAALAAARARVGAGAAEGRDRVAAVGKAAVGDPVARGAVGAEEAGKGRVGPGVEAAVGPVGPAAEAVEAVEAVEEGQEDLAVAARAVAVRVAAVVVARGGHQAEVTGKQHGRGRCWRPRRSPADPGIPNPQVLPSRSNRVYIPPNGHRSGPPSQTEGGVRHLVPGSRARHLDTSREAAASGHRAHPSGSHQVGGDHRPQTPARGALRVPGHVGEAGGNTGRVQSAERLRDSTHRAVGRARGSPGPTPKHRRPA